MKTMCGVLICGSVVFLTGCSGDDSTQVPSGNQGQVTMYMTDAPADFDAVNIVITRIDVRRTNPDTGWITIKNGSSMYNMLTLRNGSLAVIGSASVSAGTYSQVRIWFGSNSNVVVAGVPVPLTISSNAQGGLILNHQMNVQVNASWDMTLDFNMGRSIVEIGAGQFALDPIFRIGNNSTSGNISGTVDPPNSHVSVWTIAGGDTAMTVADTVSGSFQLVAVPQGSHVVYFRPGRVQFRDTTLAGVNVQARQNTSVGMVIMPR